ncbi:hypothetical protein ACFIOY_13415 [Bradyrhizobium sp. TZ2]|jgi:hypothetical protein
MTTKSRQSIYGASVRAAAERAKEARNEADIRLSHKVSELMLSAVFSLPLVELCVGHL